MVKEIIFKSSNGMLRFVIENPFWCKLFFENDNKNIFLGGDSFLIIQSKLLAALVNTKGNKSNIKLENKDIIWAISLLETYTSIFISLESPKTMYFLYRDKDINDFDKLILANDEYLKLMELLNTEQ